ncbi:hypothetical protein ACFVTC_12370 [Streptomyces sp. NPDC057950]|uniref:hypothetical protein n=1 Tax=Streptomyces sp. NPDC057950 TaxID=3346288 RepID=UPI0036E6EB5E
MAFWEKFRTRTAGGNRQAVFRNEVGLLRKYDKTGVPLGPGPRIDTGNAGVKKIGQVGVKRSGIPVGSNAMSLVAEERVFEKSAVAP